jgi:hypothetical protein
MVPSVREAFNHSFTREKYKAYVDELHAAHPGAIEFRIAETPVFVSKKFLRQMLDTCESIIDLITDPAFKTLTDRSIPADVNVPNENGHSHFIAFDFGICENAARELEPQLIEMQGFPTIFAYQVLQDDIARKHFNIPPGYDCYIGDCDREKYITALREIIVGREEPKHVVLLEVLPHQQKTRIDFYCTEDYLGIKTVCLSELIQEGRKLYYMLNGEKTAIRRIYNRVIFDDLRQQSPKLQQAGNILSMDLEVEWVPHPNWFYRISKFTLPFIRHPYVPATFFLNEVQQIPADLQHYVLKPLFSFAGQGVVIDLTAEAIAEVPDPQNWILQRKVKYADIIDTPDIPAKAEIRLFYFWKDGAARPVATNNLARLSKGKMIGVRYNENKEWVGGTLCYFEK